MAETERVDVVASGLRIPRSLISTELEGLYGSLPEDSFVEPLMRSKLKEEGEGDLTNE